MMKQTIVAKGGLDSAAATGYPVTINLPDQ
jgi:hypothetical protein